MKNFQFSIFNFQKNALICFVILLSLFTAQPAHADDVIDNGINFLKSKQDVSGRITTGFSAPSQWSAIAFTANGTDVTTVKNPTVSLKDFLVNDIPQEPTAATDWENRILAIVAIGGDPSNFGGVNFIQKLEGFYNAGQIGDTCSLNDDIFGLLALIASGPLSNTQVKQDTLNFLISKQDPNGGFGFSAPGCDWYSTSADITAAAAQALQAAKDNGVTNTGLDSAITKAKDYLLANQNGDGGFGYFGSSDTDTTGWVLMAFNALGMRDSAQATNSRNWLLSQQSGVDGGFLAFDWATSTSVSNASTTAQALIALSGKNWILKIFAPISGPTPTPPAPTATATLSSTPTPTSSSSPSNSCSDTKPEIPVITNAEISDDNEIILTWKKSDPAIDHFLLVYGETEKKIEKGNISYTTDAIPSGETYQFKLKSVRGCASSDFSNIAIVTISQGGTQISRGISVPTPTTQILGEATEKNKSKKTSAPAHRVTTQTENAQSTPSVNKGFMGFSFLSFSGAFMYWYLKLRVA